MPRQVARALAAIRWNGDEVARFVGHLTEPKPHVVFVAGPALSRMRFAQRIARDGVKLEPRSQLLYDALRYYVNGEDAPLPLVDREALQSLADRRMLDADACRGLSAAMIDLLHAWHRDGFLATGG
jgi:50S ribosomal protein L16 3-hydroxylase